MVRLSLALFCSALALVSQVDAYGSAHEMHEALARKINPPLKDVKSDEKFFGPHGDYGADKRPVVQKSIMDKLKGPDQPYPALQSKADFDTDYVKDENSDKGAWEAQFEYDQLRRKLAQEETDSKSAEDRANKKQKDVDGAQAADDAAGKDVDGAQKDVDDAANGENVAKKDEDFGGAPSAEKLEKLKKALAEAEEKFEKQQVSFEKCQKELEDAKKKLEELQAQHAAMEKKLDTETKLWAEQKAVKLNLEKNKQGAAAKAYTDKVQVAADKLHVVEKAKAEVDAKLAKEKAEHDAATKKLQQEKAEHDKAKTDLDNAAKKLQQLRGYKPATPTKSGARMTSVLMSLSMVLAIRIL